VKVGEEKPDKTLDLVAPRRPMTIQDLMRHTSGLTYGFFGEGAVKKAYLAANLEAGDPSTAEFVEPQDRGLHDLRPHGRCDQARTFLVGPG
jgi:CubicO group peptidase (beta-lactamase class C family)